MSLENLLLTENYYNFFCIIKIPIHGIDSKGLGFILLHYNLLNMRLFSVGNAEDIDSLVLALG